MYIENKNKFIDFMEALIQKIIKQKCQSWIFYATELNKKQFLFGIDLDLRKSLTKIAFIKFNIGSEFPISEIMFTLSKYFKWEYLDQYSPSYDDNTSFIYNPESDIFIGCKTYRILVNRLLLNHECSSLFNVSRDNIFSSGRQLEPEKLCIRASFSLTNFDPLPKNHFNFSLQCDKVFKIIPLEKLGENIQEGYIKLAKDRIKSLNTSENEKQKTIKQLTQEINNIKKERRNLTKYLNEEQKLLLELGE